MNQTEPRTPITVAGSPNLRRLECLQRCLSATSAWIRVFFGMPETTYLELPASVFHQLRHVLESLSELTVLEDPAWDCEAVRRTHDVFRLGEQVANTLDNLPRIMGSAGGPCEDVLKKAAWDIRVDLSSRWGMTHAVGGRGEESTPAHLLSEAEGEASPSAFVNDQWLADMLKIFET